ncbi:DUF3500 domain-containing protein [Aliiglaciecola sp. NS0011-25]
MTALLSGCGSSSSDSSSSDTDDASDTVETTYTYSDCSSLTLQVELMACLAENFLSTLTDSEIDTVLNDLTENNATETWSNLPAPSIDYNGILIDNLSSDEAKTAAEALLSAALSADGNETMEGVRMADEYLSTFDGNVYGEDNYAIALLGSPSTTAAWMVEFTGHHYTFFSSFNAEPVSLTPNFVAIEPVSWTVDNQTYAPMAKHHDALVNLFDSLDSGQLVTALLEGEYDDVLVGPQDDGNYPEQQEGLSVSELTDQQKDLVIAVITAYAADANETGQLDDYISDEQLAETYVAYASYPDMVSQSAYARIDGPSIWIEFTVQGGVVFSDNHYHSIWRDKELDYGGNFDL